MIDLEFVLSLLFDSSRVVDLSVLSIWTRGGQKSHIELASVYLFSTPCFLLDAFATVYVRVSDSNANALMS